MTDEARGEPLIHRAEQFIQPLRPRRELLDDLILHRVGGFADDAIDQFVIGVALLALFRRRLRPIRPAIDRRARK